MANVDLTVYDASRSGIPFTTNTVAASPTNTYRFKNNGKVFIAANSTTGGTLQVTTPKTEDGLALADKPVTLAAATQYEGLGPWPPDIYNDDDGYCSFTVSIATDVMVYRTGA